MSAALPHRRIIIARLLDKRLEIDATDIAAGVDSPCWLFAGKPNGCGYGRMRINGRLYYVHRVAAYLWHSLPLHSEKLVRHRCIDRPTCFNPRHLLLGDHAANNRDTVEQGRWAHTVLSEHDVRRMIHAVRSGRRSLAKCAAACRCAYSTALKSYKGIYHTEAARAAHATCDAKGYVSPNPFNSPAEPEPAISFTEPEGDADYLAAAGEAAEIPF